MLIHLKIIRASDNKTSTCGAKEASGDFSAAIELTRGTPELLPETRPKRMHGLELNGKATPRVSTFPRPVDFFILDFFILGICRHISMCRRYRELRHM